MGDRLPHGAALEWASRDTTAARARLERIYGRVPACVFFYQREPEGPVNVTHGLRIVGRVTELYRGDERPVLVRAVVPGGRELRGWLQGRSLEDARRFGKIHAHLHSDGFAVPTLGALRVMDPELADFERLYSNGATDASLMSLTGLSKGQVRARLERMRRLGFIMPHRRVYSARG